MIRKKQRVSPEAGGSAIRIVWEGEVHTRKWIRWTKEREEKLMRLWYVQARPADSRACGM